MTETERGVLVRGAALGASLLAAACTSDSAGTLAAPGDAGTRADVSVGEDTGAPPADASRPATEASRADARSEDAGRPRGAPPEVLAHAKEWPMPNRDYASTRATTDTTIDASNVSRLAVAWAFPIPGFAHYGSATAVPIVLGNVVYYQDMASNVFALDARTGAVLWEKEYSSPAVGPNGLAIGWGKIFTASSDATFVALDLATGQELWAARIPIPKNGGIDVAPVAYGGLVYTSTVPIDLNGGYVGGGSGVLYALDERTGEIVWRFDTDESGNLWGNVDANSGGGAWYPPSIDESRGLTYWGTGNPGPHAGTKDYLAGTSRPGPNLYTSSVVALGFEDGALRWYHQERPHDLFDLDFQNSPVLVDARIDGGLRRVALGSGKTGTVVALDADTGELYWRTPVGKHENDDARGIPDGGFWVFPGYVGGIETPPAYADGSLYVSYNDYGIYYLPRGFREFSDSTAGFVAIDVETGAVKWKADYGGGDGAVGVLNLGGATVANDVVFTSTSDGIVYAYERASGREVWRYQAPAGINAPLAVAGDTLYVAAGTGVGMPTLVALRVP